MLLFLPLFGIKDAVVVCLLALLNFLKYLFLMHKKQKNSNAMIRITPPTTKPTINPVVSCGTSVSKRVVVEVITELVAVTVEPIEVDFSNCVVEDEEAGYVIVVSTKELVSVLVEKETASSVETVVGEDVSAAVETDRGYWHI